ncbi:hypothetical protein VPH35_114433 [Triticum aestivum]
MQVAQNRRHLSRPIPSNPNFTATKVLGLSSNGPKPPQMGFSAQGSYDFRKAALIPYETPANRPTTTLCSTAQQTKSESQTPSPITVSIATPLMRKIYNLTMGSTLCTL